MSSAVAVELIDVRFLGETVNPRSLAARMLFFEKKSSHNSQTLDSIY